MSTSSRYLWRPGEGSPTIDRHSLVKHEVLGGYVRRYIEVRAANPRIERLPLLIVDTFAGGGTYRDPASGVLRDGSPLILLNAVREAEAAVNARRTKRLRVEAAFHFVERDAAAFRHLNDVLRNRGFDPAKRPEVHTYHAPFAAVLPKILGTRKAGGRARAIVVMDQYGYSKVNMKTIRGVFDHLPNAEVFLTFATDHLIDYLGRPSRVRKTLLRTGLGDLLDALPDLKETEPARKRQVVQRLLHEYIPRAVGARYYTPFFITSGASAKSYWLVHLSGHHRARDVVTEMHWKHHTSFAHYGGAGIQMLGFDPRKVLDDPPQTFDFGESAGALADAELDHVLPSVLHPFRRDGVSCDELYEKIANSTPATSERLRQSLLRQYFDGGLAVYARSGLIKKPRVRVDPSDIVRPTGQGRLLFG